MRIGGESLARGLDRRREHLLPRQRAILLQRVQQPRDGPRDAHSVARETRIRPRPVFEPARAHRAGSALAVVDADRHRLAGLRRSRILRQMDDHEPPAADPAGIRANNRKREAGRDRRVHGVAAELEHAQPRHGCHRVIAGHDAPLVGPPGIARALERDRGGFGWQTRHRSAGPEGTECNKSNENRDHRKRAEPRETGELHRGPPLPGTRIVRQISRGSISGAGQPQGLDRLKPWVNLMPGGRPRGRPPRSGPHPPDRGR